MYHILRTLPCIFLQTTSTLYIQDCTILQLSFVQQILNCKLCLKLYKSIYGLKQAGCKWYEIVCCTLADLGFKKCDPAVLYIDSGRQILILAIHIDNCTVTGLSHPLVQWYRLKIKSKYALTDLGAINWLLDIKITWDRKNWTISLSQSSCIDSLLKQFNLPILNPSQHPWICVSHFLASKPYWHYNIFPLLVRFHIAVSRQCQKRRRQFCQEVSLLLRWW